MGNKDDDQIGKTKKSDYNCIVFLSISFSLSFVIEIYYKVEFVMLAVKSYFIFYHFYLIFTITYELHAFNSCYFNSLK